MITEKMINKCAVLLWTYGFHEWDMDWFDNYDLAKEALEKHLEYVATDAEMELIIDKLKEYDDRDDE